MTHILTHTENLQSHLAGALRSARWLYVFVLIPFYCFQQRKMWPFPCQQKLTHTGADCGADPHPDPHGETKDRSTWSKEFPTSSFLQQKCPQSLIYQRLEGFLSLGKDEVGGSNPPSSSKKKRHTFVCLFFFGAALLPRKSGRPRTGKPAEVSPSRSPFLAVCGGCAGNKVCGRSQNENHPTGWFFVFQIALFLFRFGEKCRLFDLHIF